MKCPNKECNKTFRQEDIMKDDVYDTLHGRHIGNNWLSTVACPHCKKDFVVRQVIKLEVFGYDRRESDSVKDVV